MNRGVSVERKYPPKLPITLFSILEEEVGNRVRVTSPELWGNSIEGKLRSVKHYSDFDAISIERPKNSIFRLLCIIPDYTFTVKQISKIEVYRDGVYRLVYEP